MAGWKIYVCDKCGYEFDEKREYKKADYISIHDKEFECPKCGKSARDFEEVVKE